MSSNRKSNRNIRLIHDDQLLFQEQDSKKTLLSKFHSEEHEILGGKALVFRTKASGEVYQLRMWIPNEKRYWRKSLREKNLNQAINKAEEQVHQLLGYSSIGHKIFSISFRHLVDEYLKHQEIRVSEGYITHGRLVTIKSQMKHFINFVGENNKVDTIEGKKYKQYYSFRKKMFPNVKDVTLINERATIGNLYKFGMENGYINQSNIPRWQELKFVEPNRRNAFTQEDYRTLYRYINNWHKKVVDEIEVYNRKLVRDFILTLANTGLRFGEMRQIKWHNITVRENANDDHPIVNIIVPKEISKVRKERMAVGLRGDIFNRIKRYSKFTSGSDFVYTNSETGGLISRKVLYDSWHTIIKESGLSEVVNDYTYYSLRHTFATFRLQEGKIDVFTLSKIMGCSVKFIEEHYGQVVVSEMSEYITRRSPN